MDDLEATIKRLEDKAAAVGDLDYRAGFCAGFTAGQHGDDAALHAVNENIGSPAVKFLRSLHTSGDGE